MNREREGNTSKEWLLSSHNCCSSRCGVYVHYTGCVGGVPCTGAEEFSLEVPIGAMPIPCDLMLQAEGIKDRATQPTLQFLHTRKPDPQVKHPGLGKEGELYNRHATYLKEQQLKRM